MQVMPIRRPPHPALTVITVASIVAMLLIKALVLAEGNIDFAAWTASGVGAPILF